MKSSNYELSVLVKNRKIAEFNHENDHYVEGREGSEFELELKNNTNKRSLFVLSVDGLSILDGKPMSDESSGYVLSPNQTIKIPGWTLDNNQVAKFTFGEKKNSYAANHPDTPSTTNVGVIGCLVYSEKENIADQVKKMQDEIDKLKKDKNDSIWDDYPWYPPYDRRYPWKPYSSSLGPKGILRMGSLQGSSNSDFSYTSNSASITARSNTVNTSSDWMEQQSMADDQSFVLGTEFGAKTDFRTTDTTFVKDALVATLVLYYDTRKNLEKLGIVFPSKVEPKVKPNPFPNVKNLGCTPPVNWKQLD